MRRLLVLIGIFGTSAAAVFFLHASGVFGQTSTAVGVSITIQSATTTPPSTGGGGGGGGGGFSTTGSASFVMKGKAYPAAIITILHNGSTARTLVADNQGMFTATLSGLAAGIQSFGVYGQDTNGRRSVTLGFTLNVPADTITTLDGILLPATLDISATVINQGQPLTISGQSFPGSGVSLFIHSTEMVKQTPAAVSGQWRYVLDTQPLDLGDHNVRSKVQTSTGEQSEFSEVKSFRVIPKGQHGTPGSCLADLNADNRVDITDLSILLYNWGKPKNSAPDFNADNRVDIVDFSILLYYWGMCI